MSSESIKFILDRRLAAGEISIQQYRELLNEISPNMPPDKFVSAKPSAPAPIATRGPLATVDDMVVMHDVIKYKGEQIPMVDVVSVQGDASQMSVNFIPMDKSSNLVIGLTKGREIWLHEDRVLTGNQRHKQIRAAYEVICQLTFKQRMGRLVSKLCERGSLNVGAQTGNRGITLTVGGHLKCGGLTVDLKRAKAEGVLGIGTMSQSLGLSYKTSPREIVASMRPCGWRTFHKESIVFEPKRIDSDILISLMLWLGEPGNALTALSPSGVAQ